jgi:orotate phosphoribosyltransferase
MREPTHAGELEKHCRVLLKARGQHFRVRVIVGTLPRAEPRAEQILTNQRTAVSISASRARLRKIIANRSFGRGEVTLASGRKSDFYFNLKPTMLNPEGAALIAELTFDALKDGKYDYVGGLEMGAVPIAGAIAQLSWINGHPLAAFFVRKQPKEYGAKAQVEGLAKGETLQGKRVVIIEDVTTTGGSALKAVQSIREAGGEVVLVLTMVDRQEGAEETFREAGVPFKALFKASEFLAADAAKPAKKIA